MDIKIAGKIDNFLGPIICLGLSAVKFTLTKLNFIKGGTTNIKEGDVRAKKILLIKFYGMGSIILITPVN